MNPLIDRFANKQLGLITSGQMRQAGLSQRQSEYLVGLGALYSLRRGVYRVAGSPITWLQAVCAACLAGGPGTVASHGTAAAVWEFRHSDRHCGELHVTAPRRHRIPGVVSHTIPLARAKQPPITVFR